MARPIRDPEFPEVPPSKFCTACNSRRVFVGTFVGPLLALPTFSIPWYLAAALLTSKRDSRCRSDPAAEREIHEEAHSHRFGRAVGLAPAFALAQTSGGGSSSRSVTGNAGSNAGTSTSTTPSTLPGTNPANNTGQCPRPYTGGWSSMPSTITNKAECEHAGRQVA